MSKVMIFNPANLEQREVSENDAERAVRELGWVRTGGANELVAVFHPGTHDHKMILKRDLPAWENRGYAAEPTVVYHPEEGARTVPAAQAKQMIGKGWYDSPADFPAAAKEAIADKVAKAVKAAKH